MYFYTHLGVISTTIYLQLSQVVELLRSVLDINMTSHMSISVSTKRT